MDLEFEPLTLTIYDNMTSQQPIGGNVGVAPPCILEADILRLEFLWHYGGMYVDADMISVGSPDCKRRAPHRRAADIGTHLHMPVSAKTRSTPEKEDA